MTDTPTLPEEAVEAATVIAQATSLFRAFVNGVKGRDVQARLMKEPEATAWASEAVSSFESELAETIRALPIQPAPDQHPDDLAVDRFAAAMKAKLTKKRAEGRGGWDDKNDCSQQHLSDLVRRHVEKGDPLDVGNLAMMLHQRGETIQPAPSPWRPISEYCGTEKIVRWHVRWKCPVAVERNAGRITAGGSDWITATIDNTWPEEAFLPVYMPISALTTPPEAV